MNLRQLLIQQPHQFVVLLDRLQRLHKHGLPARTGTVYHTLHPALLFGLHRNHKALAAYGDQLILHCAILGQSTQVTA